MTPEPGEDFLGVYRLYVDANVFIYFLENNGPLNRSATRIISCFQHEGRQLVTSEITLAECLYGAFRDKRDDMVKGYRLLLRDSDIVEMISPAAEILELAAWQGAALRLRLADAIHVATAMESGCDAIITNDKGLQAGKQLRVIQLASTAKPA
ncbi:MAG: type II toxin-antitoxin system VapC family toxin [Alphaproteobacteria bacterium]|nr:type II toxin-antitoxin system VapC family toxin [Alphaproteobacteria bacterium]